MKRICLITHCEATHSVEQKVGGWYDSELTDKGKGEASILAAKIRDLGFDPNKDSVYTSDLKRAAQTAGILCQGTNAVPIADKRLREMSFGAHEGMSQEEHLKTMVPVSADGNRLDHPICNGAESRRQVAERISELVSELMQTDTNHIVVTHGFAATFFIAVFQKIPTDAMGYLNFKLKPGSISILEEDDLFQNRTLSLFDY